MSIAQHKRLCNLFRLIVSLTCLTMSAVAASAQTFVSANFSTQTGAPTHSGAGFLCGMTEDGTGPSDSLLMPLNMTLERASGGGLPGGGWVGDGYQAGANYYRRFNSMLSEARRVTNYPYHATFVLELDCLYGEDAGVPNEIWPCDNGNTSNYIAFIDQVISDVNRNGLNVSYEVQNEPDNSYFWQRGLDSPQYFLMWDTAVREIRRLKPGALIVGPSYSNFFDTRIWNWLNRVKADGTVPNTLNWHFSDLPVNDGAEVAGMLSQLGITGVGLSMNECITASNQNSGYTAWFLTQLGKSNVTQASHSDWGSLYDGSLDQVLVNSGGVLRPTGQWWSMRRYGDQGGSNVSTTGSGSIDLIASTDPSTNRGRILLGSSSPFTGTAVVNIYGLYSAPYLINNNQVQFIVERIPDSGPNPIYSLPVIESGTLTANNGQLTISVPWSGSYDAYAITLGPNVAGAANLSGYHTLTPMNATGSRLEGAGWGTANGTKVQIWQATGGSNQSWYFNNNGSGSFNLEPSYATGMCVDVSAMGTTNGTFVQLWQATGANNQQWIATSVSGSNIYNLTPGNAAGMCLDVSGLGTANGTQVQIWQATGANNQQWQIN